MLHSIVRKVPLFSNLPDVEIDSIVSNVEEKKVPAGSILFREGDYGNKFYIVVEGTIDIIKFLGEANEVILNSRGPGEFIGEMSLFNQQGLRTASVRAETDVDLLEISRKTIENLLSRQPTVAYEMLMLLSRRLSESNQRNINDLKEKNAQLAQAYEELQRAQRQVIAQGIMDQEIRQARDLQRSLLPGMLPRLPGFDLGARMIPSSMVGGDFYDVIRLDADHIGLAVGDVAGKGVPAAMFMFLACSLLRSEAHLHASPSEVLNLVNKHLRMANPRGLFVTVLYGVLHLSRSEFTYARAGHERPLIWKEDGEVVLPSEGLGQPLGVFENPSFDVQTVHLPLGSTLVIFTDGITEAHNSHDDIFGEECLQELVPELLNLPAQEFCDRLVALLDQFYGGGNRSDDITVLAVKTMP